MKIRSKLFILSVLPIALALLVASVLHATVRESEMVRRQFRVTDEILRGVFELNILTYEYLQHHAHRVETQWNRRHADLKLLLDRVRLGDPRERELLQRTRKCHDDLGALFMRLAPGRAEKDPLVFAQLERRLAGQLIVKSQSMVELVSELDDQAQNRARSVERRSVFAVGGAAALLGGLMAMAAFYIRRNISIPLSRLQRATRIIGKGDVGYRVGYDAPDELGDLSRAFDTMLDRLRETTVSRDELVREVAERRRVEEALRESESRHRMLVETMNDGLTALDPQGLLVYANEKMGRMVGRSPEEVVGHPVTDFLRPDNIAVLQDQLERRKQGEMASYELVFQHRDGQDVPTLVSPQATHDRDGSYTGSFAVITDITELKRSQAKVREAMVELERSNRELEQFAYVASHDLQEPLRMVASFVQLLAKQYGGKLDDSADEFIGFAVDGAKRMQSMIDDLLTYSRVGTRGKKMVPIESATVFQYAIDNLKVAIEESGAQICCDALPLVRADQSQLLGLFQNLLSNAIKFRKEKAPRIHVSAEQQGQMWVFGVKDNGIGIDPKYADRIFMIFQRLHTRDEYPGTGIGLAVCKKIVERHGGEISVESEAGQGTTFRFTLPVLEEDAA